MPSAPLLRLGLRVAVLGSSVDNSLTVQLLRSDPDVELFHVWNCDDHVGEWEKNYVDLVVSESEALKQASGSERVEFLRSLTLIVNVGEPFCDKARLPNVETLDHGLPHEVAWSRVKYRVLLRRLIELNRLVTGSIHDQPNLGDESQILELESTNGKVAIAASSIEWARAAGAHVELRSESRVHLVRLEMYSLEEQLPTQFVRIHRRMLVNLECVLRIDQLSSKDWSVVMFSGERFRISRERRARVKEKWKRFHSVVGHSSPLRRSVVICESLVKRWLSTSR